MKGAVGGGRVERLVTLGFEVNAKPLPLVPNDVYGVAVGGGGGEGRMGVGRVGVKRTSDVVDTLKRERKEEGEVKEGKEKGKVSQRGRRKNRVQVKDVLGEEEEEDMQVD